MTCHAMFNRFWKVLSLCMLCAASVVLWGCGGDDNNSAGDTGTSGPAGFAATKATCSPGDKAEPDLQGQVSAATRAAGFKGYNCNLQLVGTYRGEGASWQHAWFQDKAGHLCNYYDTSAATADRRDNHAALPRRDRSAPNSSEDNRPHAQPSISARENVPAFPRRSSYEARALYPADFPARC